MKIVIIIIIDTNNTKVNPVPPKLVSSLYFHASNITKFSVKELF